MKTAKQWVEHLNLEPHPEGGWFKEIYRNTTQIQVQHLPDDQKRNLATSIYFLLDGKQISKLHRLKSDEIWYFHYGSPLKVHTFTEGEYKTFVVGSNFENGETLQLLIPAGTIFGAEVVEHFSFSLVGCMVTPGFHFNDFEMLSFQYMMKYYSPFEDVLVKLT